MVVTNMRLEIPNQRAILLRTRLFFAVVFMVLLSGLTVSCFTIVADIQAEQTQVIRKLEAMATLKNSQLEAWIHNLHTNLTMLFTEPNMIQFAGIVANGAADSTEYRIAYTHLQDDFQHILVNPSQLFDEVFLVSPQGRVALSTDPEHEGILVNDQNYFREGSQKDYLAPPVYSPTLGQKFFIITHPIYDQTSHLICIIAGRVGIAGLNEIMTEYAGLGDTGESYLVDSDYTLLTLSRFDATSSAQSVRVDTQSVRAGLDHHIDSAGLNTSFRGVPVVGVYRWSPELHTLLVAEQSQDEAFASVYTTLKINIGISIVVLLCSVWVALYVIRGITAPLSEIAQTATQIANGKLDLNVPVKHRDEIGMVALAFNQMTAQLHSLIKQLQSQVAELEHTQRERERTEEKNRHLASFPQKDPNPIIELNRAGQVIYVNPAMEDMLTARGLSVDVAKTFLPADLIENPSLQEEKNEFWLRNETTIQDRVFNTTIHYVSESHTWRIYANDITDRKRAEKALRESEERYRALFDNMTEGFALHEILCDEQGKPTDYRFLDVNLSFERLTGLRRENVIGKLKSQVLPEVDPFWVDIYGRVALTGEPIHLEHFSAPLERWYEVFAYCSAPQQFAVIFMDVTQRKQTEAALHQSQERFRVAQELSLDAFTIMTAVRDAQGMIVDFQWEYVNPKAGRILRHSPEALVGRRLLQVMPGNQVNSDLFERYVRVVNTGEPHDYELHYESEGIDGWFRNMTVKLGEGIAVYFTDITERKISEQALLHRTQESEEANRFLEMARIETLNEKNRLEAVMETLPVGVALFDDQRRNTLSNPQFEQIWGRTSAAIPTNGEPSAYKAWWVETGQRVKPDEWASAQVLRDGKPSIGQLIEIERADGSHVFVLNSAVPVKSADHRLVGCAVAIMDITERVRAEKALRESEARFKLALKNAPVSVAAQDCNLRFLWAYNQRTVRPLDVIGKTDTDLFPPEDAAHLIALKRQVIETGIQINEQLWITSGGQRVFLDLFIEPLEDKAGQIIGVGIATVNLTEMKLVQQALQASEESLRLAYDAAELGTWRHDLATDQLYADERARVHSGFTQPNVTLADVLAQVHPDDRARVEQEIVATYDPAGRGRYTTEYRIIHPDGKIKWLAVHAHVHFEGTGDARRPVMTVGTCQDITERKRTEEALRASELRYRRLFNNAVVGIFQSTQDGKIITNNPAHARMFGYNSPEELTCLDGNVAAQLYAHPEHRPDIVDMVIERSGPIRIENEYRRRDGSLFIGNLSAWAVYNERGEFEYLEGFIEDITERKRVEAWLRQLSYAVEQSPASIVITDIAGDIEYINPKFTEITGYTLAEVRGKNPRILKSGKTPPELYEQLWRTISSGKQWRGEFMNRKKNGVLYWESVSISPINDDSGKITHYVAVKEDITERRRIQEMLRDARDELEIRVRERTAELEYAVAQIGQNARRSEMLEHVASQLNAQLGLETVLNAVCEETARALDLPAVCLSLYNEKQDQLELVATLGLPAEFSKQMRPVPYERYEKYYRQLGSLAVTQDIQLLKDAINPDLYKNYNLRTAISARLDSEDKLLGTLNAFTIGEIRNVTENDRALLRGLARQAGQAITNARLYKSALQARQIAETLTAANLALTASLNIDNVLETLLDYLVRLVPYDSANIMLLEAESRLSVRALRGYEQWANPNQTRTIVFDPLANPILREMFVTHSSVLISDTQDYPGWVCAPGAEHVRNWLGVPLVASNQVIGLYSLDKAGPNFFTSEHQRLAEALAAQATIAVQNAWLFEQVRVGREGLQSLSRRLVQVQENERRYVARELHDEAGQLLTGLKVGLRVLEREANSAQAVRTHVSELQHVADNVLENLHRLAVHLRPATLDQLGLVAALREYIEDINAEQVLSVEFEIVGFDGKRLPSTIETALYRIVQEALTNIVRHAHATHAEIILEQTAERVRVTVDDNGIGFDFKQALQEGRLGLLGVQERVEMLNGKLTIESGLGEGTTLVVEVPYADSHSNRG
jgi:PAS domain S-box-containing protein